MVSKISLTTSRRSSISTVTSRVVMISLKATGTPSFRMAIDSSLCADAEHRFVADARFGSSSCHRQRDSQSRKGQDVRPCTHRRLQRTADCTGRVFRPLPTNAWQWLFLSGLVHLLYLLALIKSFEQSDMTVAYPIARGVAPMLAAAAAVAIFHEPISVFVALGIGLITFGVMFIGISHPLNRRALMWAAMTGS